MTTLNFLPIPTPEARNIQRGGTDAYGMPPLRWKSDGGGAPCRHCLSDIKQGEEFLVLAYKPFPINQPYAETGPIFLHAAECDAYQKRTVVPALFNRSDNLIVRGYDARDQICYWAAEIVPTQDLETTCKNMLKDQSIKYLHIRSTKYNCYQCRVERA